MIVQLSNLAPVERAWCVRTFSLVGESPPEQFDTARAHAILYWKSFESQRLPFERIYAGKFVAVFNSLKALAESTYRNTTSVTSVVHAVRQTMPSMLRSVMRDLYSEVGTHFGSQSITIRPAKAPAAGEFNPMSDPNMQAWFNAVVGVRITKLTTFTAEDIQQLILDATDAGTSIQDIVKQLEQTYSLSRDRAIRIARTETVSASNAGTYFSMVANIGYSLTKVWLSTQDSHTRDTHVLADQQKQSMSLPFEVGSSHLLFPGDPSLHADAKELVNCRCTLYFERAPRKGV